MNKFLNRLPSSWIALREYISKEKLNFKRSKISKRVSVGINHGFTKKKLKTYAQIFQGQTWNFVIIFITLTPSNSFINLAVQ
jgi:hypothetical protein